MLYCPERLTNIQKNKKDTIKVQNEDRGGVAD
jgi:hypothetical protein